MKLFVGGLSANLDDVDLKEMFELYGDVQSAMIVKDKATGKGKGFGFLDMPNAAEAKEAMDLLDGVAIFGKKIAVKPAEEQPRKTSSDYRSNDRDNRFNRADSRNSDSRGGYDRNSDSRGGYDRNSRSSEPRNTDRRRY